MLERTISVALGLSDLVAIIGHEHYRDLHLTVPVVMDDQPGRGPLGGIATALRIFERPRTLMLGCDMPCLSRPLLRMLIERPAQNTIVIPRTPDGRWQTLHAIYPGEILRTIEQILATGDSGVHTLLSHVPIDEVPTVELQIIDRELISFLNLNHRDDIPAALRCLHGNELDTIRRNPCG